MSAENLQNTIEGDRISEESRDILQTNTDRKLLLTEEVVQSAILCASLPVLADPRFLNIEVQSVQPTLTETVNCDNILDRKGENFTGSTRNIDHQLRSYLIHAFDLDEIQLNDFEWPVSSLSKLPHDHIEVLIKLIDAQCQLIRSKTLEHYKPENFLLSENNQGYNEFKTEILDRLEKCRKSLPSGFPYDLINVMYLNFDHTTF